MFNKLIRHFWKRELFFVIQLTSPHKHNCQQLNRGLHLDSIHTLLFGATGHVTHVTCHMNMLPRRFTLAMNQESKLKIVGRGTNPSVQDTVTCDTLRRKKPDCCRLFSMKLCECVQAYVLCTPRYFFMPYKDIHSYSPYLFLGTLLKLSHQFGA